MPTTLKFTKEAIQNLTPQKRRYAVSDSQTPNLQVVVYPSGVKTFILLRKVNGKVRRIKIGRTSYITIEQARKEAIEKNSLIALGHDPQAEKRAKESELTLKEMYDHYYQEYAVPFTKRPDDNRTFLERHAFPRFGNLKGSDVTRKMMRRFHIEVSQIHSKSTANRIIGMISAVYNFCIKNEYFNGINPCIAVKRFRKVSRDRFLSPEELEKFFCAVNEEEELQRDFVLIALYTGARRANTLSMKWSDIDFANKRWRISEEQTKNADVNIVVLPDPAIEILLNRFEKNKHSPVPSLYVFPGDGKDGHFKEPKKALKRIRKRMGVYDIRLHDLRRTLGSYMAITGASLPIIGAALNHKSQDSTVIYARLSQAPVHNAVNVAVKAITGNYVFSRFKENKELLAVVSNNEAIKFSELLAA